MQQKHRVLRRSLRCLLITAVLPGSLERICRPHTMAALEAAISKLDQIIISLGGSVDSSADALAAAAQAPPAAPPPAPGAPAVPAPPAPVPVATAAAAAVAGKAAPGAREVLTNKVMIKVARVASVERQPNSEKLLKLKIELGADETRQVMAGLAQYVQPEQLAGRLVCVVANLKPAKLAGEPSEAMVLAADTPTPDGGQLVRVLLPPGKHAMHTHVQSAGSSTCKITWLHTSLPATLLPLLAGLSTCMNSPPCPRIQHSPTPPLPVPFSILPHQQYKHRWCGAW